MLEREGVTVIHADEAGHARVRGRQVFQKLVRDQVPARIHERGECVALARIGKWEARTALLVKLFEEANELLGAGSPDEVMAELADLLEVVRALAAATGVSWDDVERSANEKRAAHGSFEQGVVLLETSWPSWLKRGEPEPHIIPLRKLGQKSEAAGGIELNYAAILAKDGDATAKLSSGRNIRVSLTGTGVKLVEIERNSEGSGMQLFLPLANENSDDSDVQLLLPFADEGY